jgi:isopenicillin-N epimerase
VRDAFTLDPDIVYLNHGSYGACPRIVLEEQSRLRAQLERQPVRFMGRELEPLLDEARRTLAAFVGADPEELAFVQNATSGVNAVVRSLAFAPGDEIPTRPTTRAATPSIGSRPAPARAWSSRGCPSRRPATTRWSTRCSRR